MRKRILRYIVILVSVIIISIFGLPLLLFADTGDEFATAIDQASIDGQFTSTNSLQGAVFTNFGSVLPHKGDTFVVLSTGDVNKNANNTGNSAEFGGPDNATLTLPLPAGTKQISFDYYYMTVEATGGSYQDPFTVELDGTNILTVRPINCSPAGTDLNGTAFQGKSSTGWISFSASVDPNISVSLVFDIRDFSDDEADSAVILDNLSFDIKTKAAKKTIAVAALVEPVEPVWIRTMVMTCYQVWVNENGNFQFVFWYPYRDNNWVKIYDAGGKEVYSINMPLDNPQFEVSLPDGIYTVKTFNDDFSKPLQTFTIGKP
jgi:hypothetical protein